MVLGDAENILPLANAAAQQHNLINNNNRGHCEGVQASESADELHWKADVLVKRKSTMKTPRLRHCAS